MPAGSRQSVISVLETSLAGKGLSAELAKRGRKRKFVDYSEEAEFLCNLFESTDTSDATAAAVINLRRVTIGGNDADITSLTAVRNYR